MAHRGLRKPSTRRSLRPRNHSSVPPRTAADGTLHAPLRKVTQAEKSRASRAPLAPESDDQLPFEDELLDAPLETESGERVAPGDDREVRVSGGEAAGTHEAPAESHHVDREDPLMDAFFRHPDKPVIDVWEETHPARAMSHGSRRAMYASIGIFAVSVIGIGGFAAYHSLVIPAPVELGAAAGEETSAVLPTPLAAAPPAVEHAPSAAVAAAPGAPAHPETQLSAASTLPTPPTPAAPTLAEVAAHEPTPEARATGASTAEGVAAGHLIATAGRERDSAEPVSARAPATLAVRAAEAEAQDPMPPIRQDSRAAPPTYDELVAIGRAFSKKNRRIEASEAFRRALVHAPAGSAALSGLSFVYLNADDNQQAREYAQRAVQADATNAEGWIVLGAALELLGDRPGAQAAYRSCVEQGRGPYLSQCKQVARP